MDPLRSLTELIRTLARSATPRTGKGQAAVVQDNASGKSTAQAQTPAAVRPLSDGLRRRLRNAQAASAQHRREVFVETVLLHEFGDAMMADPGFGDIVRQVAGQLGADPVLDARLRELLDALALERP